MRLTLHHYGFLTADTAEWLEENQQLFGKPWRLWDKQFVSTQNVYITFVQQNENDTLLELIEPASNNSRLQKMLQRGITIYHTGYTIAKEKFEEAIQSFESKGAHTLPVFNSEAFDNNRCVFIITKNLGMIELIER